MKSDVKAVRVTGTGAVFAGRTRLRGIILENDEHPRMNLNDVDLKKLKTVFKENGTVTPGNSSGINDGAAGVVLTKKEIAQQKNFEIYGILGKSAENILLNNKIKENGYFKSSDNIILNNKNKYISAAIIVKIKSSNSQSHELLQSEINVDYNVNELIDNLLLLPRITMTTKETYIPQVLNLEDLNGINYKKGCYTGQEIVARTHYLGKIKKKIFLLEHNEKDINIADKIHDIDGELVGEIFTSTQKINDVFLSLGVIKLDSIDKNIYARETSMKIIQAKANL